MPAQPTCPPPTKAYLAECKKKLDPETKQDDGGNPIADGLKGLANAIDKYLLSLNVGKYEGPPTDPDEDGCVYRETGKGVLRAKVNPFGVSVARVTIGWVKSKEKKVGEDWVVVPPPVGEGLVQYRSRGLLAMSRFLSRRASSRLELGQATASSRSRCLKAGEGLTTVRSLGFVNKKKPQPPA
ncbi:hypothetical protein EMIHUDRAFT_444671 [Emiliania huxleyi CCMP1516]|uniref:Uncharacterized protein n=2 Tax=Emiliania huxleyi TaxID=2903 RepID=A0A0D3JAV3_EMIH1|nr:hypothetical protein EMIHUDRAFT_444671 [Emiliania huxleyi CCMP1516]EOD20638.1 hypothetical protein EMIHUDRAFT_444671 [Emiliania huxleyi CCMP1516]|eukprot:XP_005773067.1 hypothetical protein EMIHUDRAFT_444671 [Emiliania huxleyi CCMP1516]